MSLPKPYYDHAGITIYNCDCREVLPFLDPVDLVLTDPPYGIGFASQPTNYQRAKGFEKKSWDNEPVSLAILTHVRAISLDQCIWGGNYYALPPTRGWLAWYKRDGPESFGDFELAWTTRDAVTRLLDHTISATNKERVGHPTQKPLKLMTWCLGFFPDAKTILDPFMGSGTTLVAAKLMGRKAIGIEIEEKYCEIAVERLAQDCIPGMVVE